MIDHVCMSKQCKFECVQCCTFTFSVDFCIYYFVRLLCRILFDYVLCLGGGGGFLVVVGGGAGGRGEVQNWYAV